MGSVNLRPQHRSVGSLCFPQTITKLNALFTSSTIWYIWRSLWGLDACCSWGYKLGGCGASVELTGPQAASLSAVSNNNSQFAKKGRLYGKSSPKGHPDPSARDSTYLTSISAVLEMRPSALGTWEHAGPQPGHYTVLPEHWEYFK
jgi:hypothetical protein